MVLMRETSLELPRKFGGGFLPRLVREALRELEARKPRRLRVGDLESQLDQALCQVEREQHLRELHRRLSVSMLGFELNPLDPNGR